MATCPECDAEIEVDEFDVDKGDQLSCPECGSNLEVIGLSPVELDIALTTKTTTTTTTTTTTRTTKTTRTTTTTRRGRGRRRRDELATGSSSTRRRALRDPLTSLGSVVVAYSGGVDSAYLA